MKKCPGCNLYHAALTASGHCEDCAKEERTMNPGQGQNAADDELKALREQVSRNNEMISRLTSGQAQQPSVHQQLNQRMQADPAGTAYEIAKQAAAQVTAQATNADFETLAELARSSARSKDPEIWDQWESEIQSLVDQNTQGNPAMKKNVQVWTNAAHLVADRHFREARYEERESAAASSGRGKAPAVRIGDGPAAPGTRPLPAVAEPDKLTPEETRFARRMGLSAEQYIAGKKANDEMGNVEDPPDAPSPFDKVLTFDNFTGKNRKAA